MEVSPGDLQERNGVYGSPSRVRLQVLQHQPVVGDDAILLQGLLPSCTECGGVDDLQHEVLGNARLCTKKNELYYLSPFVITFMMAVFAVNILYLQTRIANYLANTCASYRLFVT